MVDNASTDGTVEFLRDLFPQVHVIANDVNVGFGAGNNLGMQAASAYEPRYYFLLNPQTSPRNPERRKSAKSERKQDPK